MRRLYARDHLDQVLATFGLILFFNELVRVIWGPAGKSIAVPAFLSHTVADPARRALPRLSLRADRGRRCWWRCCSPGWWRAPGSAC